MYIGVDLHKKYSYVTRMTQEGEITFQGRVEHEPDSLRDFAESISEDDNIAVEATGNWYYFYELIEGQTPNVSLAHPRKTRAMASAMIKTDKIDSKALAYLLRADMLPEAYIPNRETRDFEIQGFPGEDTHSDEEQDTCHSVKGWSIITLLGSVWQARYSVPSGHGTSSMLPSGSGWLSCHH